MQRYLEAPPGSNVPKIKKQMVSEWHAAEKQAAGQSGATRLRLCVPDLGDPAPRGVAQVVDMVTRGAMINLLGLGSTLLGIQALVGVLVAKTLSNASANPFIASAAGVYNPVLALDVFLVQVG